MQSIVYIFVICILKFHPLFSVAFFTYMLIRLTYTEIPVNLKGFISKFPVDYSDRHKPDEGEIAKWSKRCDKKSTDVGNS